MSPREERSNFPGRTSQGSRKVQASPLCGSALPVAALGLLAIAAGVAHDNALAAAFGIPLALGPAVIYMLLRYSIRRLEVEREAPPAAFEGENVAVRIRLHNRSRLPVFFPAVADLFTPEMNTPKPVIFPYRVLPGETVEETYQGKCVLPRGIYTLGPAALAVSDPFGWIQLQRALPIEQPLKVYPPVRDFGLRERLGDAAVSMREDRTRFGLGESLEFFSVREYQSGDPLRRVHWPLTAHRGVPVVREFARIAAGNMAIFLDLYRPALIGIGRGSSLEHAVKIAVALANRALRRGHRVQVIARGVEDLQLAPGAGPGHLRQLLDLVVRARPNGDLPLPDLIARNRHLLRPGDCVVFPVSPYLYASEPLRREIQGLRRRGMRPVALVFDDLSFRALWHEETSAERMTPRFIARLSALGVECYRIHCGADLERTFRGAPR